VTQGLPVLYPSRMRVEEWEQEWGSRAWGAGSRQYTSTDLSVVVPVDTGSHCFSLEMLIALDIFELANFIPGCS
jgi:hypothetical protein